MSDPVLKQVERELIPVIDIGPLRDGSDPVKLQESCTAPAAKSASSTFPITHSGRCHCFGARDGDALLPAASRRQEHDCRQRIAPWFPSVGGAKMQDDAKADLKESFVWDTRTRMVSRPDDHELRGTNRWPGFMPDMQAVSMDYFKPVHVVAHHLMRGFALGLDLPEDTFLKTSDAPISRAPMSIIHRRKVKPEGSSESALTPISAS